MKVLITDADQRSSLVILRSLAQKKVPVIVAGHQKRSLCFYSKYAEKTYQYSDPFTNEKAFIRDLLFIARETDVGLIIPATDRTLIPLSRHRHLFKGVCHLAIPDDDSLWHTLKKEQTFLIAKSLGVPYPKSFILKRIKDLANFKQQDFKFPIVIKPSQSKIWKNGKGAALSVSYAKHFNELEALVQELVSICPVILQEWCGGVGVGVEMLRWNKKIVAAFQHRRIREYPISGGASTLRVSQAVHPDLFGYSKQMLDALNWNGVAMIEFKHDPLNRKSYLMEINGRFWGSLSVAVNSGVDFPYLLYQMYQGYPLPEMPKYKIGLRCRHIETDLLWLKDFVRNPHAQNNYISLKQGLLDFFRIYRNGWERQDILSLRDPLPGIISLSQLIVKQAVSYLRSA